jgi:AcrR family transcriptional regulator
MSQVNGRREANKQATRAALHQAAERLFAEHGYEATTVAQITQAAHVGERTFYRYFGSKEDLLAERAVAWMGKLADAIRSRPAAENSYQAVARAMTALAGDLASDESGSQAGILVAQQPLAPLRRIEPRPMRRLEQVIAGALGDRLAAGQATADPPQASAEITFEAQLVARVAVAALRTVILWQRSHTGTDGQTIQHMLGEAFIRLAQLARAR